MRSAKQGRRMITSIRQTSATEATIMLATGVHVTYRLPVHTETRNNLVEIRRWRVGRPSHERVEIPLNLVRHGRRIAFNAIAKHRASMRLPDRQPRVRKAVQLPLKFL